MIDILRDIEARALKLRATIDITMEIDGAAPAVVLPIERPLYSPVRKPRIDSTGIGPPGEGDETDPAALFEQVYVAPASLRGSVRRAPRHGPQAGLVGILAASPLTQGLAELVTYLSLRDEALLRPGTRPARARLTARNVSTQRYPDPTQR